MKSRPVVRWSILGALLLGCALPFITPSGCTSSNDGATGANAACVGTCPERTVACANLVALCPSIEWMLQGSPGGQVAACVQILDGLHSQDAGPPAAVAALDGCLQAARDCSTALGCFPALQPRPGKACDDPPCSGPDDAGSPPIVHGYNIPNDAVMTDKDDPSCVECAFAHCKDVIGNCFVEPSAWPGCQHADEPYPDCCMTYRQCVQDCLQNQPNDVGLYDGCVASSCDSTYKYGRPEYDAYVACMAQQCAGCGVKDGGP
jgi:hypothetical protein